MNYKEVDDTLAFHPGYYIEEYITSIKSNYLELSDKLGISVVDTCNLVNGLLDLDKELAKKLEEITGSSKEYWLNLQNEYNKLIGE